ncbi:MAG: site-specific DNA-methyltransferase [Pseudorhodobacter sp.]|nr:site-specific DNA-methyltransferase [Pseudorhodobacter sp.]
MSLHPGTDRYNPAGNSEFAGADLRFTRKAEALALGIINWSTPKATDGAKGGPGQSYGSGGMPPLPAQAAQWPTPAAQNWKGSSEASITRADGKSRLDILHYRAEQGFTRPAPMITLDGLLRDPDQIEGGAVEGEDDIPEPPVTPVSVAGDLWLLGSHRLICGDSTSADVVGRLLGDVKPLLMVTDPPYGVEYDPSWRNQAGAAKTKRTGKVLNDDRADWREAWSLFPGDVAYVWHGALHAATVADSLTAAGFAVRSQIIWAKDRLVLSRGDYHWQHEPCWYAVRVKGKGHWAGDRKQTTLWHISGKDQDAAPVHGTQKPVECMRRPILNNSSPGQAVFEPFMGSGTTLIAAETTGRVCFGIELNPVYVDVAIERWQQFTGANAVLAEPSQTAQDRAVQARGRGPRRRWSARRRRHRPRQDRHRQRDPEPPHPGLRVPNHAPQGRAGCGGIAPGSIPGGVGRGGSDGVFGSG